MAGHGHHYHGRQLFLGRELQRLEDEYADAQKDLYERFTRAWLTQQRVFDGEHRRQRAGHEIARENLSEHHRRRRRDRRLEQMAEIERLRHRYPGRPRSPFYGYDAFYDYETDAKERHREENYEQQARYEMENQDLKTLHRLMIDSNLLYQHQQEEDLFMAHQQQMRDLRERVDLERYLALAGWMRPWALR